jgi:hypothetical protein
LCAQCHAQSNLAGALGNNERHHPIDSQRRQQQCDSGKAAEEDHAETIAGELVVDDLPRTSLTDKSGEAAATAARQTKDRKPGS